MPESEQVVPLALGSVTLRVSAVSDVGSKRKLNEDSYRAEVPAFLVADGMGGHAHGDWASRIVTDTFSSLIPAGGATTSAAVLAAISASNSAVRGIPLDGADESSMAGTTVSGIALVKGDGQDSVHWMIFNVGDSRVYTWDGGLAQLTVDHSAVQELIERGEITETEAPHHAERNVITRAIGVDEEVEPDVWLLPVGGHQMFMICTDGLTKELPDAEIAELFASAIALDSTDSLSSTLVSAAIASGGLDNITVVVVESSMAMAGEVLATASSGDGMPAFLEETLPRK